LCNVQRVNVELRRRRQPAHTLGAHVVVDHAAREFGFIRQRRQQLLRRDGFVTPLAGMVVEERGAVHLARRTLPVQTKRQRLPAGLRTQFFLPDIVCPAATTLTDATAEDQHVDQAAIVHVEVIPVVHPGTDDNHRTAMGFVGVIGKFVRDALDVLLRNTRDFFCPGWRVGFDFVVALRAVFVIQTAFNAVVRQCQVVNTGHQTGTAICQLQAFDRQFVHQNFIQRHAVEMLTDRAAKIRIANIHDLIMIIKQAQLQADVFTVLPLAGFQIPLAFFTPAVTDRT